MGKKEKKCYISSRVLLEMVRDECAKEQERGNNLDNKSGFFITVILAVATIFVPIIPLEKILSVYQFGVCVQKCCISVMLFCVIISFLLLIGAFRSLYEAYKLTDYMHPDLSIIDNEGYHILHPDRIEKGLCDHYKTIVCFNRDVNNRKCDAITLGIKMCSVGFVILIVSTVGMKIIIGG